MSWRFFLVAGEPSGDRLGAALMQGLQAECPGVRFAGIGGPLMQARGLDSLFPMDELSVMGIVEILPRYRRLMRRIDEAARAVLKAGPDALITIDSPDFGLRVAKRVKAASDIRTVHYVAPTVWAWRAGRAGKMAAVIDQVLALFPFEPPYMEAVGMVCDFVGHPVVAEPVASARDVAAFRNQFEMADDAPILLVLPGSRRGEVGRLAPVFGEVLRLIAVRYPKMRVIIPTVEGTVDAVREAARTWPGAPVLLDPRGARAAALCKRAGFAAADVALAASGTVSLELAAADTPMVVAYDVNWFSRQIIKRMLRIDTVTLVNLVSDTRAVPEFLGRACEPVGIAGALDALIRDDAAQRAQRAAMALTMDRLGRG
ncbi:MAG: lipid-A-disaccharide synthase, partial [Pseudomonadota bacterium]